MSVIRGVRAIRLLPVTILMCGLLLGVKCIEVGLMLVPGVTPDVLPSSIVAAAQAASPTVAEPTHETTSAKHADTTPARSPALTAPEPVLLPPPGPPPVSSAERDLLQDLRGRRVELDAREKLLTDRQDVLDAAEHRFTARIAELSALQARLEQLDAERHAHDDANWMGIVKVYETMKPRDAAAIFNDMEMSVLLPVVDRMKDAKAALVMAAMQPDRARLLTIQLAARRTQSITVPGSPVPAARLPANVTPVTAAPDHAAPPQASAS